jgi:two-component system invasion response regulator UvrY
MTSRVLIVDDHEVVRMGVRTLLAGNPKWAVCGEAADGEHAIQEFVKLGPDVVILDLSLPVKNGFEVAKEMRRIKPSAKIVLFTMHEIPTTSRIVGADAFVAKTSGIDALMATLERLPQRHAVAERVTRANWKLPPGEGHT